MLDASTALAALFPDEDHRYAEAALRCGLRDGLLVPTLWAYEIQNGLLVAHRRGRIAAEHLREALALVATWNARFIAPHGIGEEARLASELAITAYEASYLIVAAHHDVPLATSDARLRAAAEMVGISVFEP